jgi:hypothetical protein
MLHLCSAVFEGITVYDSVFLQIDNSMKITEDENKEDGRHDFGIWVECISDDIQS